MWSGLIDSLPLGTKRTVAPRVFPVVSCFLNSKTCNLKRQVGCEKSKRVMIRVPQRPSLVSQTVDILKEEIRSGRWNKWLPGEHELCAQLHVSRRTMRAALDQLQSRGIVRCSHGKRRKIASFPAQKTTASNRVIFLTPAALHSMTPFAIFLIDRLRGHLAEEGYWLFAGNPLQPGAVSRPPFSSTGKIGRDTAPGGVGAFPIDRADAALVCPT
jgi:DNA-binding transcriptional regulator YhcF (GntR family)